MTILEALRASPWLAVPSNQPTCQSRSFDWDGGYFVRCTCCGRVGPVPVMLHVPHTPPAVQPKAAQAAPLIAGLLQALTKLLPF